MEIVFEILIQILAELFLQILFELGVRSLIVPSRKKSNPYLSFFGYVLMGALAGFLSLLFFKELFIKGFQMQVLNLFITPLIAGFLMSYIGRVREKKGVALVRLDKFTFGFVFALAMALVRFISLN